MAMEELHMAALAYYNNSNRDLQNKAWDFFNSMDSNGNRRVSYDEFIQFFMQFGYNWADPNFYHSLDRDHDGLLNFWEVLTLYYIMKTRSVRCQCCTACQIGLYFTCVTCFHSASHTFDICIGCYSTQRYRQQHDHGLFLDSYVLLRSKKGPPPGLPDLNQFAGTSFCSTNCCYKYTGKVEVVDSSYSIGIGDRGNEHREFDLFITKL